MWSTLTSCLAEMVSEAQRGPVRAASMMSVQVTSGCPRHMHIFLAPEGSILGMADRVALKSSQSEGPSSDSCACPGEERRKSQRARLNVIPPLAWRTIV